MDGNGLQSPVQEAIRLSENFIVVEVGNVFLFKGAGDGTPWLLHFHGNEVAALLAVACKVLSLAEGILTCLLEGTASRLGVVMVSVWLLEKVYDRSELRFRHMSFSSPSPPPHMLKTSCWLLFFPNRDSKSGPPAKDELGMTDSMETQSKGTSFLNILRLHISDESSGTLRTNKICPLCPPGPGTGQRSQNGDTLECDFRITLFSLTPSPPLS